MNYEKKKNILLAYLKTSFKYYLAFFGLNTIILMIFYVYNISVSNLKEATIYSFILSFFAVVLFFIWDFRKFYKKEKALEEFKKIIDYDFHKMPKSSYLIEDIYQDILKSQNNKILEIEYRYNKELEDIYDYYTLWVHQIKTPIAATKLMLANSEIDPADISTELFKIEEYVEMVLIYLRLDSDNNDLVIKRYDLDKILKASIKKYARMFINSGLRLNYESTDAKILTDEKWFSYVIEQILSNAIKYSYEGEVNIYVEEGNTLVIEDKGIGIMESDLPLIFEKGYTGINGRADGQSSGLGLYLCKNILDMLSHRISITSETSIGTRVTIDFAADNMQME